MTEKQKIEQIALQLHGLVLFRPLLQQDAVAKFVHLLDALEKEESCRIDLYSDFVAEVYQSGGDFGALLLQCALESDNAVVRATAAGLPVMPQMQQRLEAELKILTALCGVSSEQVQQEVSTRVSLAQYAVTAFNFEQEYTAMLKDAATRGYGIFAGHHMFTLQDDGALKPVKNPDTQCLQDLTGYKKERAKVVVNTESLLQGLPANNVLLYGDAGTGKSSTVKAIANQYKKQGLRLVEIRKSQLYQIPALLDSLAENPLKFILFIDDLSFEADDSDFTALKAILEGNIAARPSNIVVYATSNRRHMVKERFSDRQGDDLHLADTLEESTSLAARFGITITFLRPDKELYSDIVKALAIEKGLKQPQKQLLIKAEAFALRNGGRSPRTAQQFIKLQKAEENKEKLVNKNAEWKEKLDF